MAGSDAPRQLSVDLPGGRVLDVQVSGPDGGVPLVWHHGTPGCNRQFRYRRGEAYARGLRLVTYTRAGAKGSTRNPGRSVADVAADIDTVLDAVGADRCVVGGNSGGGPHALATGALLPDRVAAVLAVCCVKPSVDQPDFLDGMGQDNVEEFGFAREGEQALRPYLLRQREGILGADAEAIISQIASLLPPVDRDIVRSDVGVDVIAGLQGGAEVVDGWLDDDLAFVRDWGFDPAAVPVPTYLWQGSADLMVPFHHAEWLAGHIPGVTAHLLEGEGHFSVLVGRFGTMLDELVRHL